MNNHYEIRFGGAGGQGLMMLGDLFAEALGNLEDKEIVLTRTYGPEARGGVCRSELIVDDDPINYPSVRKPNFVLAMSQEACDKYHDDLASDGVLLVESAFVKDIPHDIKQSYSLPMTEIAKEVTGKALAANVVAIGAVAELGKFADLALVKQAVLDHFKPALRASNEKAFEAGVKAAQGLVRQTRRCHSDRHISTCSQ